MKKYVLEGPEKIEIREAAMPQPADDELLIKVKYVGICGSDIHLYNGDYKAPHRYPLLLGHEWAGIVEKAGKNAKGFKEGDILTGDCSCFCGKCANCSVDKNMCEHLEKFGLTIDGATAEYIIRDVRHVYKAPKGSKIELVCLAEPLSVAARMIERIKSMTTDLKNKRVLIYGGGLTGTAALMLLTLREGCENVDLIELSEYRTDIARSLGPEYPTLRSCTRKRTLITKRCTTK